MPQRIRAVIFDMDDVLCRLDDSARLVHYARLTGQSPEAVREAIWGSGLDSLSDSGRLTANEYLELIGERLGRPITLAEWAAGRRAGMTPCYDVLASVARLTVPRAVLTNNGHPLKESLSHVFPEAAELFPRSFWTSADFGVQKPDPAVYLACCAANGYEPEGTLFIDDRLENVVGAEHAGLMGHHFTGLVGLETALAEVLA